MIKPAGVRDRRLAGNGRSADNRTRPGARSTARRIIHRHLPARPRQILGFEKNSSVIAGS
jgi:hypothetical protein